MKYYMVLFPVLLIASLPLGIRAVFASSGPLEMASSSSLHPDFFILDADGINVLESLEAVSTMQTCGQCHDTGYISSHAFHSDLGLSEFSVSAESWNSSNGLFGQWDPLTYRFLSPSGDQLFDLGTPEWLMLNGSRVVGGGPGTTSRSGLPLKDLTASTRNPETSILNKDGRPVQWNWRDSGILEMDCFLCHLENPNLDARSEAIRNGDFANATTLTLSGTRVVELSPDGWRWNPSAFNIQGEVDDQFIQIQDPTNANCGACHGEVHTDSTKPLLINACDLNYPQTATTGQVISAQRISASGVNLSGKNTLDQPWDIHAERQLKCTDCHYSLNNPSRSAEVFSDDPDHLIYDPRSLGIGEYLEKPDHNFARGQSAQFNVAPDYRGTMRRCENCHDSHKGHADWLPYIDTHMAVMACEACHIPRLYAPAIQAFDWTVITPSGNAVQTCRGVEGPPDDIASLVTGFMPILLNRTNIDGKQLLAPYNLITTFYWVYDDAVGNSRPVRLIDLEAIYLDQDHFTPEIMGTFDENGNGWLSNEELVLNTPAKMKMIKSKLEGLGLANPRVEGLVRPYSINHDVTHGRDAIHECSTCHHENSRISQPIKLSNFAPVVPVFDRANNVKASGVFLPAEDGGLYYKLLPEDDDLYIFGASRVTWIDRFGALMFAATLLGVAIHGTLRYASFKKNGKAASQTKRIFMYEAYRRVWHWLQTASILILLFTGLIIHRPDLFGVFSFRGVVTIHNVLAVILVINAALSLFYHIATERIREFIPRPHGFFDDAILQAKYYIRGIFKGERHPFEKLPRNRMNPIQKVTYFGILNVLLPLQIITGALMWGVQEWPQFADSIGGLPFLAPFHSLVAWTFGTFILVHIYMTTTGTTPLEAMRAMITGYEQVETHTTRPARKSR